jgi:uncharacterized protein
MLTLVFALLMATPIPAKPAQYVTDRAGVLDASRAQALNEKLADFERKTSDQILVYVDKHVPEGTTLEEMGAEAIKTWGVGQKGKDNGAIFFIFTEDRKMRIEVGYGLEGSLTDFRAKQILSTIVKPHFKSGDFGGGIEAGVEAIVATIRGESFAPTPTVAYEIPWYLQNWVAGPGIVLLVLMMFAGFFLAAVKQMSAEASRARPDHGVIPDPERSSFSSSDYSSSSNDSSSSSDSDFSSGGGSGGGGGASDSW